MKVKERISRTKSQQRVLRTLTETLRLILVSCFYRLRDGCFMGEAWSMELLAWRKISIIGTFQCVGVRLCFMYPFFLCFVHVSAKNFVLDLFM